MLVALSLTGAGAAEARPASGHDPVATIQSGAVRGVVAGGAYQFRGVPYAAPPTGRLRWRAPRAPKAWHGIRDATSFAPNCPQPKTPFTPGATAEGCLYLNITTNRLHAPRDGGNPVLVWIHGGGNTIGAGQDYDPAKLAAEGTTVVTVNYRLGALGFLAHPALASRPGGASGNYGLMDQQAALRWVRRNIHHFGGDPRKVTIAGQSSGGLSVLAQLVSAGSRGLFQRAIVQSGSFALEQQPLAAGEADGKAFAAQAGCTDQRAECLRRLPVAKVVAAAPDSGIPGIVDGKVLTESIGTALASGHFHRVPIINGTNHEEERLFLALGSVVSGGASVPLPEPVTAESYQRVIAATFGVSDQRARAIAAEYPVEGSSAPAAAFSAAASDANFSCPALAIDRWTAKRVPTFAYELNDDTAPERFVPQIAAPPAATHQTELQYLFGLPHATIPGALNGEQETLATAIRRGWARFADSGQPARPHTAEWPSFRTRHERVLSLVAPRPSLTADYAARHHCAFWAHAR